MAGGCRKRCGERVVSRCIYRYYVLPSSSLHGRRVGFAQIFLESAAPRLRFQNVYNHSVQNGKEPMWDDFRRSPITFRRPSWVFFDYITYCCSIVSHAVGRMRNNTHPIDNAFPGWSDFKARLLHSSSR